MLNRILIVDDNPALRALSISIFSDISDNVLVAKDGIKGLSLGVKAIKESCLNLILTDCQMPGMDGLQMYNSICEQTGVYVPVVFASGNDESLEEAEDHLKKIPELKDKSYFLKKPYSLKTIFDIIEKIKYFNQK